MPTPRNGLPHIGPLPRTGPLPHTRRRSSPAPLAGAGTLPTRRAARAAERAGRRPRPAALGHVAAAAVTLPLRSVASAVAAARALPVTAVAVATCMVVSLASPQTAVAATPQVAAPALGLGGQQYVAPDATLTASPRDGFRIAEQARRGATSRASGTVSGSAVVRPVLGDVPTAGGFGHRTVAGCAACSTDHQGLDFAAAPGAPVLAVMSGRVVSAGPSGGYGNQVLLAHPDGTRTRYAHLSRIDVRVGQEVRVSDVVGAVGNTGVSTGPHLHFEVIVGGTPVDPAVWLHARGLL
ncbi:M23 family metallopeptidase [Curtobacterium sp. 'Ferrero']|uniref:M23 family metallopeptidase n=1 Tax=Curtobacterium sp. 'Ferrero' TaxID=2033654 RepID=UPI0015971463|nr:M23 family metallopeptidase [Curtobacterium sp. 'Ferrero']